MIAKCSSWSTIKACCALFCDTYSSCVLPVLTGSHLGYKAAHGEPFARQIVELLLVPVGNVGDAQMVRAIDSSAPEGFDWGYAVQKLRELAASPSPKVREEAALITARWQRPPRPLLNAPQ